ncbi:sugar phosphate isomerase/epimerase family protein [Humisphaera borealis]|uniref:TIM barrel protein n=1 Tax=Humisphaera borealis TaxID=2807512 RepID=A0A7M2X338_9BACT|nr:TIM barrel protein [Humisphaera borealis]QOV91842.1 TIM barrel protein [Humisphaera borealis]
MQLTFNTAIAPQWDLTRVPSMARAMGYAAVEVHLPNAAEADPAAGSIVADRDLVGLVFAQAEVQLAGLAAGIRFCDSAHDPAPDAIRRMIELARRLRCPRLRVLDAEAQPGRSRTDAVLRLADKLLPLADRAADAGVQLLIQNAITCRTASSMWRLLEQVGHPALACAWDPLASVAAGEDPMVPIPVLNSRIQLVVLRDATLSSHARAKGVDERSSWRQANAERWPRTSRDVVSLCRPGDGELDLRRSIDRLSGIGFAGPVVVSYPPELPPEVGPAEALLGQAAETWKAWTAKVG